MATARELWEASRAMALRARHPERPLGSITTDARDPYGEVPPFGMEPSPVYLAFFGAPYPGEVLRIPPPPHPGLAVIVDDDAPHRPRGATIARSRALRRWRVACHRARKGLARGFPATTGFDLAPVTAVSAADSTPRCELMP